MQALQASISCRHMAVFSAHRLTVKSCTVMRLTLACPLALDLDAYCPLQAGVGHVNAVDLLAGIAKHACAHACEPCHAVHACKGAHAAHPHAILYSIVCAKLSSLRLRFYLEATAVSSAVVEDGLGTVLQCRGLHSLASVTA